MAVCPSTVLTAAIHLQNKQVHGSPVDYAAVVLSSFASWIGVPGPGEAVVVTAGGVAGWLIGRAAGRPLITAPGPLLRWRRRAVALSERFYARFGVLAVFL